MNIFLTYGDVGFEKAKTILLEKVRATGEFDIILSFGREDLSEELLVSDIINIKRGGGLWSWKPDVILSAMINSNEGDYITYCDAGCSVYSSQEWDHIWGKLEKYDIFAQRIYQRTDCWTRKEIIDKFASNRKYWPKCYQYMATVLYFKNTSFSRAFVKEWRDLMIYNPKLVMDVTESEKTYQHKTLIENRHDQALFSSLIYKYIESEKYKHLIYTQWEHIEDYDPFYKQAIRATRLSHGEKESVISKIKKCFKRIIKDYFYKPFYCAPLQFLYSKIL